MPSERAALIAAILAAPDDDAVRLVCADWFEEQGDEASVARAEFIRTQIHRANLPPEDPRHSELHARELRLLKRHAAAWCGLHFVFKKVRFRRGFIEYVHLHLRHFLHHRRQMFALEPVRDVSLTGWCRAPDDLVRRVAGCQEWKHVETLRVHHQGPHKDPRSNLVLLLESPHLSGLRALRCPLVQFDADARRRFERLEVLRRLTYLHFPTLNSYPHNPGDWFCEDAAVAEGWGELRRLRLPFWMRGGLLQHLSATAWWPRLTALDVVLPHQAGDVLSILHERLPEGLEELRLATDAIPANLPGLGQFLDRLARVPLQRLHLQLIPLEAGTLARLLGGTSAWGLRELSLVRCHLTVEHASVLSASESLGRLLSLNLSGNLALNEAAARVLFSRGCLRSLVHLDLGSTSVGSAGAQALAAAPGWDRLRSLDLSGTNLDSGGRALVASPNARNLNWLSLSSGGDSSAPSLEVPPDLGRALTQLPHLAYLRLDLERCDPATRRVLAESDSLAWVSIQDETDDVQTDRARRSPQRTPPLDAALEDGVVLP